MVQHLNKIPAGRGQKEAQQGAVTDMGQLLGKETVSGSKSCMWPDHSHSRGLEEIGAPGIRGAGGRLVGGGPGKHTT